MEKKERENIVIASKVRDFIREAGCQTSGDFPDAVSDRVYEMIKQAVELAKNNGRATVRPHDL